MGIDFKSSVWYIGYVGSSIFKEFDMSVKGQKINWEDINVKAGIAFTLVSIAILMAIFLLTR